MTNGRLRAACEGSRFALRAPAIGCSATAVACLRNAIVYVLHNWKHHEPGSGGIDPGCSGRDRRTCAYPTDAAAHAGRAVPPARAPFGLRYLATRITLPSPRLVKYT